MTYNRKIEKYIVDTQERWAIVHSPATTTATTTAVLVFHGSTSATDDDTANDPLFAVRRFERNYDTPYFRQHREWHGYTMIYLAARLEDGWFCWENNNGCRHSPDGNDAKFVQAIIDEEFVFDKIYALGFSGGARFVWKHRELFDAMAPIAGGLAPSLRHNDSTTKTNDCIPAVVFHGDRDTINDIQTNRDSVAWYQEHCNCKSLQTTRYYQDEGNIINVTLTQYQDCDNDDFYLHFYIIHGAGHTLPGAPLVWSGLGPISSFDSLEHMWYTWTTGGNVIPPPSSAPQLDTTGVVAIWFLWSILLSFWRFS